MKLVVVGCIILACLALLVAHMHVVPDWVTRGIFTGAIVALVSRFEIEIK